MRGLVAMGKGQWKEAAQAFEEASRRDPSRESYQFNHALAQIQSADEATLNSGIQRLAKLSASGKFASPAKRALIRLLMRHQRYAEALEYAEVLVTAPDAKLEDQLTRLDLLRALQKPEFTAAMETTQIAAAKNPVDLSALLTWSVRNGFALETRKWVDTIDAKLREDPKAIEAYAELLAECADWKALADLTARQQPWMRGDAMREAFAALAAEKSGTMDAASAHWQLALQAAVENYEQSMALAYFAHRAGWRPRLLEVLWAASNRPDSEWALRMLHKLCAEDGNTEGMLRVARRLLALHPEDDRARNNAIILALLLDEPPTEHLETARLLHEKAPGDPVFATTYAFALHCVGKSKQGLTIIQQLPVEVRRRPDTALYHAILLAADDKKFQAEAAAEVARTGPLLPEEKKLLNSALAK
jgi:tetratricopeptide (TPR) repeat protein